MGAHGAQGGPLGYGAQGGGLWDPRVGAIGTPRVGSPGGQGWALRDPLAPRGPKGGPWGGIGPPGGPGGGHGAPGWARRMTTAGAVVYSIHVFHSGEPRLKGFK